MSDVTILVPFRATSSHWEQIRAWQYGHLNLTYPDVPVVVASDGLTADQPFNRSKALNNARANADTDWLWVLDTDTAPAPDDLAHTIAALGAHGWICPYAAALQLDEVGTRYTLQGLTTPARWNAYTWHGNAYGLPFMHADVWDDVGGFDEAFTGWGWEDAALHAALSTLHPPAIPAPIEWIRTLRHARPDHPTRSTSLNAARYEQHYRTAGAAAMRQIVEDRCSP